MQDLFEIPEGAEKWRKDGSLQKLAIVAELPSSEQNEFSKFSTVVIQNSPLGWVPVSSNWKYHSRHAARDKAHRLGYTSRLD